MNCDTSIFRVSGYLTSVGVSFLFTRARSSEQRQVGGCVRAGRHGGMWRGGGLQKVAMCCWAHERCAFGTGFFSFVSIGCELSQSIADKTFFRKEKMLNYALCLYIMLGASCYLLASLWWCLQIRCHIFCVTRSARASSECTALPRPG